MDTGSPVSDDYKSPNPYTGNLRKVVVHLAGTDHTKNDVKEIRKAELAVEAATE